MVLILNEIGGAWLSKQQSKQTYVIPTISVAAKYIKITKPAQMTRQVQLYCIYALNQHFNFVENNMLLLSGNSYLKWLQKVRPS